MPICQFCNGDKFSCKCKNFMKKCSDCGNVTTEHICHQCVSKKAIKDKPRTCQMCNKGDMLVTFNSQTLCYKCMNNLNSQKNIIQNTQEPTTVNNDGCTECESKICQCTIKCDFCHKIPDRVDIFYSFDNWVCVDCSFDVYYKFDQNHNVLITELYSDQTWRPMIEVRNYLKNTKDENIIESKTKTVINDTKGKFCELCFEFGPVRKLKNRYICNKYPSCIAGIVMKMSCNTCKKSFDYYPDIVIGKEAFCWGCCNDTYYILDQDKSPFRFGILDEMLYKDFEMLAKYCIKHRTKYSPIQIASIYIFTRKVENKQIKDLFVRDQYKCEKSEKCSNCCTHDLKDSIRTGSQIFCTKCSGNLYYRYIQKDLIQIISTKNNDSNLLSNIKHIPENFRPDSCFYEIEDDISSPERFSFMCSSDYVPSTPTVLSSDCELEDPESVTNNSNSHDDKESLYLLSDHFDKLEEDKKKGNGKKKYCDKVCNVCLSILKDGHCSNCLQKDQQILKRKHKTRMLQQIYDKDNQKKHKTKISQQIYDKNNRKNYVTGMSQQIYDKDN